MTPPLHVPPTNPRRPHAEGEPEAEPSALTNDLAREPLARIFDFPYGDRLSLNPIEQVFAKLKGFVRKAAPRTLDRVSEAIAQAITTIPPNECANYLAGRLCIRLDADCLSYDFWRREGEKEPLGEGGCPLVSGEGRIGSMLTV
jgi:transposase